MADSRRMAMGFVCIQWFNGSRRPDPLEWWNVNLAEVEDRMMIHDWSNFDRFAKEVLSADVAVSESGDGFVPVVRRNRFFVAPVRSLPDMDYKKTRHDGHAILCRDPRNRHATAGLVTLSFSGGRQSTWLLEKLIRGEWDVPENFLVVNADPGAEDSRTYEVIAEYRERCADAGIRFVTADGPKIIDDILGLVSGEKGRIDNPPLWNTSVAYPDLPDDLADHPQGEVFARAVDCMERPEVYREYARAVMSNLGQLTQCCTKHYKIAPIRRVIRNECRRLGIPIVPGCVETWIGFAAHETQRAEKSKRDVLWQALRFPMIERGVTADQVALDWDRWGLKEPCISMCKNCPFHGLRSLQDMYETRPDDWIGAMWSDREMRDFRAAGCDRPVYQSKSCIPLEDLAMLDFDIGKIATEEAMCDTGLCFV